MGFGAPHPPERRAAVEELLRDSDLTMEAIAARTGVPRGTITNWNLRAGWRRPTHLGGRRGLSPANWPQSRLEAMARLYYEPRVDPSDLAEAVGTKRGSARALFLACGFEARRARRPNPKPEAFVGVAVASDPDSLKAALRAHVARQVAALDAALRGRSAAVIDSSKVLRDLGGLKRLLDDLAEPATRSDTEGRNGETRHRAPKDLEALREAIARRYAAFAGERPDAGLPEAPATSATERDRG